MSISYNDIFNDLEHGRISSALNEINELDSNALNDCFKKFGELAAQRPNGIDLFARFSEQLPQEKIDQALQGLYNKNFENVKDTCIKSVLYHQELSAKTQAEQPSWIWAQVIRIYSAALIFFETIIQTYGIADAFSYNDYSWTNGEALLRPWHNVSTFVLVWSTIFEKETAKKIALIASCSIAAISLLYPFIKPYPARFKHGNNWTQAFLKNELNIPVGRLADIQHIANALRTKKKALLIGKTGVGKTETIKALVSTFQKDEQYQDLKDLQVVYVNAPDLAANAWSERLIDLVKEVGRHNNKTVLVLDEIHTLCQKDYKLIAERLKTLLDDEKSGINYAIGITTEEEYMRDIYLSNPALARRFKTIPINPMSSEETESILLSRLNQTAPYLIKDPEVLKYIIDQFSENESQPFSSINVLDECIMLSENPFPQKEHAELANIKMKREKELAEISASSITQIPRLTDYTEADSKAKEAIQAAEKKIADFQDVRNKYIQAKTLMYTSVKKCMLMRYLVLELEKSYERHGKELNIPTHLSKQLVDTVVAKQRAMKAQAEMLMRGGTEEAKARQSATSAESRDFDDLT
ncbi:MAG: AAA family ATPase [Chlamydiia bacterium]|nr:AAA family ATPase [Chlamydiia bacterium]